LGLASDTLQDEVQGDRLRCCRQEKQHLPSETSYRASQQAFAYLVYALIICLGNM
jgi:hypothetical protein